MSWPRKNSCLCRFLLGVRTDESFALYLKLGSVLFSLYIGLHYKHITVVNDASRVIRMTRVSDATAWSVTYDRNWWHKLRLSRKLQYLCEAKDFSHKWDEMRWHFVKTKSLGLRKPLLNTLNFRLSYGQNLPNFWPFFSAWTKVNKIKPIFDCFSKSF